ncbi:peroxisome assembly protein (Peroxin-2) [Sporothrix epigloea]|uniref:Peroxisome assembly protein (Peroxin-2) n=1 Tax=Sporothrix epigloea TaxID=1892477 RepID=A0ABP0DI11_9PEZI
MASTLSTVTTTASFAEAQRRLAARRQERALAEVQRRTHLSNHSASQRGPSAVERSAGEHLAPSTSSPLVRRLESTARVAWDGATRAATNLHSAFHGSTTTHAPARHRPAFRVTQVDAELLDEELLDLLRGQVTDALQYIRGGTLQEDWQPEVMLLLRAALFKLSVWDHNATYGAALQNLRYADARGCAADRRKAAVPVPPSKWQKTAYGVVTVGGRYVWTKWQDWLRDHDEEEPYAEEGAGQQDSTGGSRLFFLPLSLSSRAVQRLARLTSIAADVYAGAALVSFLVFLRYGCYRTVLDRVLRMRLVPPTNHFSHEVSFEYLNRQLVWHAFTEFLLFLLPLVGIHRWRRWLTRTWRKTKSSVTKAASAVKGLSGGREEDGTAAPEKVQEGELAFLPERTCAICYQDQNTATSEADIMAAAAASSGVIGSAETDITNPYEAIPCGCVYCYVSLATRIEREEGDGWTCLRCGTLVTSCRPWNGDVLEPAALSAANGARIGSNMGPDGRPLSSSTNTSGSPSSVQKTVGFADDVKGVDNADEDSDDHDIQMKDLQDSDDVDSAEASASDDEPEVYEEDENADSQSDAEVDQD